MKIAFTERSLTDLREIGDWIATDNQDRARRFVEELAECCRSLEHLPRAWPLVQRYKRLGVRRRPIGDYLIFFRIVGSQVTIIRVLHGARDYNPLIFPES